MKKIFLFVIPMLAMFGCKNQDVCPKAMDLTAKVIAAQLECSNVDQINVDLKVKFCTQAMKGPVADTMCPLVVEFVSAIANGQVPKTWQCKKDLLTPELKQTIITECKKVPY